MWKRRLPIIQSRLASFILNADLEYLIKKPFIEYIPFQDTEFKEINLVSRLEFKNEEITFGTRLLTEMGIHANDWFVCINARDDFYHSHVRVGKDGAPRFVGDKSHRNADIATYMSAAEYICSAGGFVLRVGWGVEGGLPTKNPRIIDYSRDYRSDFGDIFLAGKCRFFIGSGAGLMAVPVVLGVPIILTNILPPRLWPLRKDSFVLPKLLKDKNTDALVPYSVLNNYGLFNYGHREQAEWDDPAMYASRGLLPVDNSSEEIRAACEDMMCALNGEPIDPSIREIQEFYKRKYCKTTPDVHEHGPNLAPSFAAKYFDIISN